MGFIKKKRTKQKENIGSFNIINGVINYVGKEEKIIKCINIQIVLLIFRFATVTRQYTSVSTLC